MVRGRRRVARSGRRRYLGHTRVAGARFAVGPARAALPLRSASRTTHKGPTGLTTKRIGPSRPSGAHLGIASSQEPQQIGHRELHQIDSGCDLGAENPTPVFLAKGVAVKNLKFIGKEEQHVRFRAVKANASMDAVAFNMAEPFACFDPRADLVDLVYELQINDWNGQDKLEMKILDLRIADLSP